MDNITEFVAEYRKRSIDADVRVMDHHRAGNPTGEGIAIVTSEVYETVADELDVFLVAHPEVTL